MKWKRRLNSLSNKFKRNIKSRTILLLKRKAPIIKTKFKLKSNKRVLIIRVNRSRKIFRRQIKKTSNLMKFKSKKLVNLMKLKSNK